MNERYFMLCSSGRECCLSALFYLFVLKLLLQWPKNCVALFSGLHGFVGVGGYKMHLPKLWEKPCVSKFFTAVVELGCFIN